MARSLLTLLTVLALPLTFITPLLTGGFPLASDTRFHLYRLIALDHAVRNGEIWPRFVPGLMFGYGLPLFNYYPPTSLYPLEALHLVGLGYVESLLAGVIVYVLVGALGVFMLARAWGGALMGLATAAAFIYSPILAYMVYEVTPVAQIAGLILTPWMLWAFWRLGTTGQRRDLLLAAGLFALLIFTHNPSALMGAGLLVPYSAALVWLSEDRRRAAIRLALAAGLGIGLSAFFWLPSLAELDYIHSERIASAVLSVHANFRTLAQTFALPIRPDPTWYRLPPIALGWPQLILALIGLALMVRSPLAEREHRRARVAVLALCAALLIGIVFLTTRASVWFWDNIPLLSYFQHPWRLLGPGSLLLAILAGAGIARIAGRLPSDPLRAAWLIAVVLVLAAYTVSWLVIEYEPEHPPAESVVDVFAYERQPPYYIGTATNAEYVPRWVTRYQGGLDGLYEESDVIPRLIWDPAVTVYAEAWELLSGELTYQTDQPTVLVLNWAYFPGWQVHIDGAPVPITPTEETGLISVDAPAGRHTLTIAFGQTPLRRAAGWISAAALAITVALTFIPGLWSAPAPVESFEPASPILFMSILAASLLVFGLKIALVDGNLTPLTAPRFAEGGAEVAHPVEAVFGGRAILRGYELSREAIPSGGQGRLVTYWQRAGERIEQEYTLLISLRNASGLTVHETRLGPSAEFPTTFWPEGQYIEQVMSLTIPPGTPPGVYTMHIRVVDEGGSALEAFNAAGQPLTQYAPIGQIEVTRPRTPPSPDAIEVGRRVDIALSNPITLVGHNILPAGSDVGQPISLIAVWQAQQPLTEDHQARVVWLDDEQVAASTPPFALVEGFPTSEWQRAEVWAGQHVIFVPGRLTAGTYSVALELVDASGDPTGQRALLGEMRIGTPERVMEAPAGITPADLRWSNGVGLTGYMLPDSAAPGAALDLTLYWQPDQDMVENLTVFVHLVDANGQIIAQRDQVPAGGARPTLGWMPGEVVADSYSLLIPADASPGEYALRLGWYNAITGTRVLLDDGSDAALLPDAVRIAAP